MVVLRYLLSFRVFGELKLIRLPMKIGGQHRGFAFVDFITKNDAKVTNGIP